MSGSNGGKPRSSMLRSFAEFVTNGLKVLHLEDIFLHFHARGMCYRGKADEFSYLDNGHIIFGHISQGVYLIDKITKCFC